MTWGTSQLGDKGPDWARVKPEPQGGPQRATAPPPPCVCDPLPPPTLSPAPTRPGAWQRSRTDGDPEALLRGRVGGGLCQAACGIGAPPSHSPPIMGRKRWYDVLPGGQVDSYRWQGRPSGPSHQASPLEGAQLDGVLYRSPCPDGCFARLTLCMVTRVTQSQG